MSKVSEMSRESRILDTFPEWGTWLVEDIENEAVKPGNIYHSGDSHFSIYYHHRRGFEDCFEAPQNISYRPCL